MTADRVTLRARFHHERARELASEAVAPGVSLQPLSLPSGWRASTALTMLQDPEGTVLVVVLSPGESRSARHVMLAMGLAHQGDRDLRLVMPHELRTPKGLEEQPSWLPTLQRLAWVRPSVRLFTYEVSGERDGEEVGGSGLEERVIPPRHEVLDSLRMDDTLQLEVHDLREGAGLVTELAARLDADARLDAAHRLSYRAWHVRGRQVLRASRGPAGTVDLEVGVGFKVAPDWAPPARKLRLSEAMEPRELEELLALVEVFVLARLDGRDSGGDEHQLQARLGTREGVDALGLVGEILREVPASRPGQRRAFIDLLGVDQWGWVHVVETKLGRDLGIVAQGLDYRIWAEAWLRELRDALVERGHSDLNRRPKLVLDFVVATDREQALLDSLAPQLEALDDGLKVRVGVVRSWRAGEDLRIRWRSGRGVVKGGPSPRFAARFESARGRLAREAGVLTRTPFLKSPQATLPVAAWPALEQLHAEGLAHGMLVHLRSSQGFALGLFGGLSSGEALEVARLVDSSVVAAEVPVLEWLDEEDGLQEKTARSPHQTQVDTAMACTRADGARVLLLVEVKLSEDDFNPCSAYQASRNTSCEQCGSVGAAFGGSRESCFQLRNHDYNAPGGGHRRRRYDAHLPEGEQPEAVGPAGLGPGCPFRRSGNQPMRLVALAGEALARGLADEAVVVLCAPGVHGAIWRRWAEVKRSLVLPDGVRLADLPAEGLAAVDRFPPPLWPEGFTVSP